MTLAGRVFSHDISIVFAGRAGQGIQTIEKIVTSVLNREGYYVCATGEYMSRVRGGSNSTQIRVSETFRNAFAENIDLLFVMDKDALDHMSARIGPRTIVIGDASHLRADSSVLAACEFRHVPFVEATRSIGDEIYINTVIAGFVLAFFETAKETAEAVLRKGFARKGEEVVRANVAAIVKGGSLAGEFFKENPVRCAIQKKAEAHYDVFINGNDAVSLGAVAGGCDFISSYPMSPATGVLTALAGYSQKLDIVVEQAEDEISAANMAIGAWYAGARALVTTSGGGFDLMTEAVSLAGITESPIVFHIAQRPGPATGLPTRTEQGDLNLVLFAGHGEFPRVILAPGTAEEGFHLAQKAFDLADKYQVPVFILTDQYFLDSVTSAQSGKMRGKPVQKYFVETEEGYLRYAFTEDGLSPRGLPGFGDGFVCLDSDEHDESGHITESAEMRVKMMKKRMSRMVLIEEDGFPCVSSGDEKSPNLIIGWGSTQGVLEEAFGLLGRSDVALIHAGQVYPVPRDLRNRIARSERVIVVENNYSGNFADLLEKTCGRKIDKRILQYDGNPFSVEFLTRELKEFLL